MADGGRGKPPRLVVGTLDGIQHVRSCELSITRITQDGPSSKLRPAGRALPAITFSVSATASSGVIDLRKRGCLSPAQRFEQVVARLLGPLRHRFADAACAEREQFHIRRHQHDARLCAGD